MYNGIGLETARGSGTNGYVQRNLSFIRRHKDNVEYKSEEQLKKLDAQLGKGPNVEILDHERKRKVELKCMEMQELMEEQGYSNEEIERKVSVYRQMLMEQLQTTNTNVIETDDAGRPIAKATHQIAEANQARNEQLKAAFGISEFYKDGSSLDPQRKAKEEAAKALAAAQKQYTMVPDEPSPSSSSSSSPSPSPSPEKRKKHEKHKDSSSLAERHGKCRESQSPPAARKRKPSSSQSPSLAKKSRKLLHPQSPPFETRRASPIVEKQRHKKHRKSHRSDDDDDDVENPVEPETVRSAHTGKRKRDAGSSRSPVAEKQHKKAPRSHSPSERDRNRKEPQPVCGSPERYKRKAHRVDNNDEEKRQRWSHKSPSPKKRRSSRSPTPVIQKKRKHTRSDSVQSDENYTRQHSRSHSPSLVKLKKKSSGSSSHKVKEVHDSRRRH